MKFNSDGPQHVNRIYGVTQDPETKEYAIVTQFQNGGNLRRLISEKHAELTWKKVIFMLYNISFGLSDIHGQNYHHKDFHSGNILNSIMNNDDIRSVISDFGMSRPADKSSDVENDKTHTICSTRGITGRKVYKSSRYLWIWNDNVGTSFW